MSNWFTISNKTTAPVGPVDVLLYGEIGGGWSGDGVEAKAFKEAFDSIPSGSDISLHIHSPGGSVFDGLAIYNTILARGSDVVAYVDGLAASAASFIAMAAGRVVMRKTSRMMIHDAQALVVGDSNDMRETADLLDRESDNIADIYSAKTGKTRKEMRELMKATTWMNGEEAKALGFADEVTDIAAVKNEFDLSVFRNAQGTPNKLHINGPTIAERNTTNIMQPKTIIALLTKHGIPTVENSTEEQLVTLLDSKITSLVKNQAGATGVIGVQEAPGFSGTQPAPVSPDITNRVAEVEAQLLAERTKRITAEVTALCSERLLDVKDWLDLAISNELPTIKALTGVAIPKASAPINTRNAGSDIIQPEAKGLARVINAFKAQANATK